MITTTRRNLLAGGGAAMALAACGNGIGSMGPSQIEARAESTLQYMYATYPGTVQLSQQAAGMLVMPLITEAGLGLGGSYGRGALRVGGATVDYYLATAASAGLQIGAQQYSHVLFFMTQDALMNFRQGNGWSAGGDIEYALNDRGEMLRADVLTSLSPVIAVVFAQAGLRVGATIEGTKYTRVIP
ncbi:lipid-binding SYLF domain-containing protein [Pseudoroseicyclus sp. H15]